MFKFLRKILDTNEREIKKLKVLVEKINGLEKKYKKLKKSDFKKETLKFKERLKKGESLDNLMIEAFALTREVALRTIGQRLFDEQLMAAICFHQGKIAEQKTGEGKTLAAVPPLYLNALSEKGCHLVTVNDYLSKRDAGWNGVIFDLLGVSVGVIVHEKGFIFDSKYIDNKVDDPRLKHLQETNHQEAYKADITYGTNNEFGFDYLRDNMVQKLSQMTQRGHNFCIVDEVDSILIDEARTPLIISAPDAEPTDKYMQFSLLVKGLSSDTDFESDEKHKTVNLTEHGIKKIEKNLGIDNLYEKDFDTIHHLEQALKARQHFHKDRDYVIKDNEIIIVDEFTGRLMFGRRYSEGLHQAIEAKENVTIKQESKTLATISFQNYFRMYKTLAGMTGTAATEAEEFKKIYNLETMVIPTHKQLVRKDASDMVYKTTRAKYGAIVKEVEERHKKGQPILIGTTSISKNQIIDEFLKRKKIPHEVLNAKNHLREASIISQAGAVGAVTVATNMAGRGVDIVLGGDPNALPKKEWQKQHDKVLDFGGLHVIGIERHESRRIDNQLRGRAGRQGDSGSSRFYVSLEDDIMRIFGGEQISKLMTTLKMPEDVPLEHAMVTKAIEQAQIKVEGFHFDSRKHLVEYDDVMNKQREIIYRKRRQILDAAENGEFKEELKDKVLQILTKEIDLMASNGVNPETGEIDSKKIVADFNLVVPFDPGSQKKLEEQVKKLSTDKEISGLLFKAIGSTYEQRSKQVGEILMREMERFVMLSTIDNLWIDHLDAIDDLREGIGLRGYAQRDPLVEYKAEAFGSFERLIGAIDYEIARRIFRVQITQKPQPVVPMGEEVKPEVKPVGPTEPVGGINPFAKAFAGAGQNNKPARTVLAGEKKIGRNDPCWCGSKKKWKKCHYPEKG